MELNALYVLLIVGAFLIVALLVIVFVIPTDLRKKKTKRPRVSVEDLEARLARALKAGEHHESTTRALRRKIEEWERKESDWQKQLVSEQAKSEKLESKLLQERQWQGEEAKKFEKKTMDFQQLQKDLKAVNDQLSEEHSLRLKLEGDLRDLKQQYAGLNDIRRALDLEVQQLTEKYEDHRRQVRDLKKDNAALSRKNEDTAWVAKSDYLKLEQRLKEMESESRRAQRNSQSGSEGA